MNVLAIDPGMATGMATWDGFEDGSGMFHAWQEAEPFQVADTVWNLCVELAVTEIVIEDFQLSFGGRAKTSAGPKVTIELIGAIRFIAHRHGVPLFFQRPADARDFSTNDKLTRMGWKTPSKPDHMRSAARHLLLRLVRNGTIDGRALLP